MVDLFEKIEEGVEFAEVENTPIPVEKLVNITYILILITRGMDKSCEKMRRRRGKKSQRATAGLMEGQAVLTIPYQHSDNPRTYTK